MALREGLIRGSLLPFHRINTVSSFLCYCTLITKSAGCSVSQRRLRAALKGCTGEDHACKIMSHASGLIAPKTQESLPTPLDMVESRAASSIRMPLVSSLLVPGSVVAASKGNLGRTLFLPSAPPCVLAACGEQQERSSCMYPNHGTCYCCETCEIPAGFFRKPSTDIIGQRFLILFKSLYGLPYIW